MSEQQTRIPKKEQQEREPDELDALLQRIEGDGRQGERSSHRKSYSLFGGNAPSSSKPPPKRHHRKNKSSISELYEAIRSGEGLAPIREDIRLTAETLKSTWMEELNEMDRGETGFFDMSMTRSLSVLPEDIPDLAHEAGVEETDKSGPPLTQYLALLFAVFAVSSKSTGFHMLNDVEAPMKQYWKMTATFLCMAPMAIHYLKKEGVPQLSLMEWVTFVAAIVCYSTQNVLFVTSLEYTTIGNAVIYANSQALLLIVGKACVGSRIHWMEGLGVVIAFSGAIMCSRDAEEQSSAEAETKTSGMYGDFLALVSAIAGVLYLTFAKAIRSGVSVSVFVFSVMMFGSFFILAFMAFNSDKQPIEWNANPFNGVFGWLNIHRLPILIYLALVCNFIGTMGFVRGGFGIVPKFAYLVLTITHSHLAVMSTRTVLL